MRNGLLLLVVFMVIVSGVFVGNFFWDGYQRSPEYRQVHISVERGDVKEDSVQLEVDVSNPPAGFVVYALSNSRLPRPEIEKLNLGSIGCDGPEDDAMCGSRELAMLDGIEQGKLSHTYIGSAYSDWRNSYTWLICAPEGMETAAEVMRHESVAMNPFVMYHHDGREMLIETTISCR